MLLDPALAPLSRWLFGTLVLAGEFFGGILMLLGVYVWVAAAAFGFEMCWAPC